MLVAIVLFHRDVLPCYDFCATFFVKFTSPEHLDNLTLGQFRGAAMVAEAVSTMQPHISKSTNAREAEAARAVDARTMSRVLAMPRCKMIDALQRRSPSQ
jgi:hypothetical protein